MKSMTFTAVAVAAAAMIRRVAPSAAPPVQRVPAPRVDASPAVGVKTETAELAGG